MCGIAGAFCADGLKLEYPSYVEQMTEVIKHRGPDDVGVFSDKYCALGHRRLSIIDLSRDGHQPFVSDDGRYQLVFNGEIYNYIELRATLESKGIQFRTKTDTEVLLKAFQFWGEEFLERCNGMFAFAIYDSSSSELFLARDRVGIKPLYIRKLGDTILFASEIKALTVYPEPLNVNYQSLFDYLVFSRTDVFDETMYREIERLPKGHSAVINRDGISIRQWWDPSSFLKKSADYSDTKVKETIADIMHSSVRFRMRSDVRVGSCLSGGLDSSILIGLLYDDNLAGEGYPTFTASFPDHPIDETAYVNILRQKYPFSSYFTFPTAELAEELYEDFVYYSDEPTTSPSFFSQFLVMQRAAQEGVTVLLDGQGGDESFAGYQYFHGFHLYGLLRSLRLISFGRELATSLLRRQHISAYQTLLFQLLPGSLKKRLLLKTVPHVSYDFFHQYCESSRIYREFFDAKDLNHSLLRHFQYKLEHLLRCEDRNSMAFSLEARVPYLDHRLIEFCLGVPGEMKIRQGETKYLQKLALQQYTIPEILQRKDKIGFGTPVQDWMKTKSWERKTREHLHDVSKAFPGVFDSSGEPPQGGFERWKINQLSAWRRTCFSPRKTSITGRKALDCGVAV